MRSETRACGGDTANVGCLCDQHFAQYIVAYITNTTRFSKLCASEVEVADRIDQGIQHFLSELERGVSVVTEQAGRYHLITHASAHTSSNSARTQDMNEVVNVTRQLAAVQVENGQHQQRAIGAVHAQVMAIYRHSPGAGGGVRAPIQLSHLLTGGSTPVTPTSSDTGMYAQSPYVSLFLLEFFC